MEEMLMLPLAVNCAENYNLEEKYITSHHTATRRQNSK